MSESIQEAITALQLELSRAKNRFRIQNECLQIAVKALTAYSKCTFDSAIARNALDHINALLPEIENE